MERRNQKPKVVKGKELKSNKQTNEYADKTLPGVEMLGLADFVSGFYCLKCVGNNDEYIVWCLDNVSLLELFGKRT